MTGRDLRGKGSLDFVDVLGIPIVAHNELTDRCKSVACKALLLTEAERKTSRLSCGLVVHTMVLLECIVITNSPLMTNRSLVEIGPRTFLFSWQHLNSFGAGFIPNHFLPP
jgi:hypothetical protein